jgi:two-component system, NtrC family, response regulator AtoC
MSAGQERPSILVVDDNPDLARLVAALLEESGMSARAVSSGREALQALEEAYFDLVLSDVKMPEMDGLELLERIRADYPEIPVVLLTGFGTIEMAVEAMRAGAASFVVKPYTEEVLIQTLRRALQTAPGETAFPREPRRETARPAKGLPRTDWRVDLARAAASEGTLLLLGETGTGKSREARRAHLMSPRHKGPFVEVHCSNFPETLLESELFGRKKGSDSAAAHDYPGRVELAEGGTLFLDEVGDLDLRIQVKLLRLLAEKQYEPLGGRLQTANVRYILATHRDLAAQERSGALRKDLFFRMRKLIVHIPPLRERVEEIEPLAGEFLTSFSAENKKSRLSFSAGALKLLTSYRWEGNVRDLESTVERLVVFSDGEEISRADVERALGATAAGTESERLPTSLLLKDQVSATERRALTRALSRAGGSKAKAARLLGVARRTLYNKLEEHGLMKWRPGDPEG